MPEWLERRMQMTREEAKIKFEEWCTEFNEAEVEPMSDNLSKAFLITAMAEMRNGAVPSSLEKSFIYQVLDKRAEFIGLKLNKYAKVLLTLIADRPGTIVMYLCYLKSKQDPGTEFTCEQLARTFPMGFPTDKALEKLWDSQKVGGDNLLDTIQV